MGLLSDASLVATIVNGVLTALRHGRDLALGPQLSLGLRPPATGTTVDAPNALKYRHLVVTNTHRSSPAHNVQVFLQRVAEGRGDGTTKVLWEGEEVRLRWAWEQNDAGPKTRTVGPPAVCDLLAVARDAPTFRLQTIAGAWNFGDYFDLELRRTYVVTFVARSDEADSEPLTLEMHWDGQWTDDETLFSTHLSVKGPPGALARMP